MPYRNKLVRFNGKKRGEKFKHQEFRWDLAVRITQFGSQSVEYVTKKFEKTKTIPFNDIIKRIDVNRNNQIDKSKIKILSLKCSNIVSSLITNRLQFLYFSLFG